MHQAIENGKCQESGQDRQQKEAAFLTGKEEQKQHCHDRAQRSTCVVERTDVAKGTAADRRLDQIGDERIARSAANALANPVRSPHQQRFKGRGNQSHQWADHRRETVAKEHEPSTTEPIGKCACGQSHDCRKSSGQSVDESDEQCRATEFAQEKRRQQWIDCLTREVGKKTRPTQGLDGGGKQWAGGVRLDETVHASILTPAPAACLQARSTPVSSTAIKAFCGMSTLPMLFIRFLPSFCLAQSFFLREMSPP